MEGLRFLPLAFSGFWALLLPFFWFVEAFPGEKEEEMVVATGAMLVVEEVEQVVVDLSSDSTVSVF